MRIREGDPLEIFTDREGGVVFRKYSPLGELNTFAADGCASLYAVTGIYCAVCDLDNVIAFAGQGKRDILERAISPECEALIVSRKNYFSEGSDKGIPITAEKTSPRILAASPIIAEGDTAGIIAFIETSGKKPTATEEKLLSATAMLIGKQLES